MQVLKFGNDIMCHIHSTFGTVLVGNDKWQMQIGNGRRGADCEDTYVYIMNDYKYDLVANMKLSGVIKGSFNVYKADQYDSVLQLKDKDNIVSSLSGEYLVYSKNGHVAFVRTV